MGLIEFSEDDPNANTTKNKDLPTESNILVVEDPFTPKWSKKDIPNSRQKLLKKQNQTSPINMNLNSHQLFELFLIIKSQTTIVSNPNYTPAVRAIVFVM